MKSNTLLLIQTTPEEAQQNESQQVITQTESPVQQVTTTTEPLPLSKEENVQAGKSWTNYIFIALLIVVFYLFFIRPQSKRAKEERKFREALKKGDKVITTAGIYGKIIELEGTTAIIETEGQGKLKIEKSAIAKSINTEK